MVRNWTQYHCYIAVFARFVSNSIGDRNFNVISYFVSRLWSCLVSECLKELQKHETLRYLLCSKLCDVRSPRKYSFTSSNRKCVDKSMKVMADRRAPLNLLKFYKCVVAGSKGSRSYEFQLRTFCIRSKKLRITLLLLRKVRLLTANINITEIINEVDRSQ
jgi:hypothetical protein